MLKWEFLNWSLIPVLGKVRICKVPALAAQCGNFLTQRDWPRASSSSGQRGFSWLQHWAYESWKVFHISVLITELLIHILQLSAQVYNCHCILVGHGQMVGRELVTSSNFCCQTLVLNTLKLVITNTTMSKVYSWTDSADWTKDTVLSLALVTELLQSSYPSVTFKSNSCLCVSASGWMGRGGSGVLQKDYQYHNI